MAGGELRTERGGQGKVSAVNRRYVAPTTGFNSGGGVADIAKSISGIITKATAKIQANKVERDLEDKLMLQKKAHQESVDTTNALSGASYDTQLNDNVAQWQSEGLSPTIIRTNVKNYKYGKAIQDFGLDKGAEADDAVNAYFDAYTDLEMRAITPLAEADKVAVQTEMKDAIHSSFNVGTAPLQQRFKENKEVASHYGITDDEVIASSIISAFRKARDGDTADLEALPNVKNKGINIIDTVKGSDLYAKMQVAKETKDANDVIRKTAIRKEGQKVATTSLYNEMINGDFEDSKTKMDTALETNSITMAQHKSLNTMYDNLQPTSVESFRKESISESYLNLRAKAQLGTLSTDELNANKNSLSYIDFKSIGTLSLQQGGAFGIGNQPDKVINTDIKNFAIDNAGINLEQSITSDLEGYKLGRKRQSMILSRLTTLKNNFVISSERLPDEEEYAKMKDRVLKYVDTSLGTIDLLGNATPTPIKKDYASIVITKPSDPSDFKEWYKGLSSEERRIYKTKGVK